MNSKKSRIDSHLFCEFCIHLNENKRETIILTDPRLTTLNPSFSDNFLSDDIPQHRITNFTLHDSDRRLCWFDSKPIEEGHQLFLCGYVLPIVSDNDSENDSNDSNPQRKQTHSQSHSQTQTPIEAQMIGKNFKKKIKRQDLKEKLL